MVDEEGGGVSIDPMCGRPVVDGDSESYEYKRRTYYFCSRKCRARFERQAERIHLRELARMGALFGPPKIRWGLA
jgi:YHS domain-containing protein